MASESKDLLTNQEAASLLGVLEGEIGQAIEAGTLRKVYHRQSADAPLEAYVLTADVRGAIRARANAQLTREDLKGMKPEEIVTALEAGRLESLHGRTPSTAPDPDLGPEIQLTREQVKRMKPEEIERAREAGQLADLLGQPKPSEV
jgi:hypothetical protein